MLILQGLLGAWISIKATRAQNSLLQYLQPETQSMGHITESTRETQTTEAQLQSDPCFNTHFFSSVAEIWLKSTYNYHLMLKKSIRPH